ncbi:hypothetical protein [Aeoliella sp. SH292]|uniref:hypothetical protein n=1 Tax=Aeoliella sp. SH292 TaxID=3454464 RepID=UPI003F9E7131
MKPLEPFGTAAFVMALLIPLSGVGGIVALLVAEQRIMLAAMLTALADILVVVPIIVSWKRHHKAPQRWRGYGLLVSALAILTVQVALNAIGFLTLILR